MGIRPFFVGTQLLFEGGEVRGWVMCMVDGHSHCWRVGGGCWWVHRLFFVGGSCHLLLRHSWWALGCCLGLVGFVSGQCAWLMGVVVIGGGCWWVGGYSLWAVVVVRGC